MARRVRQSKRADWWSVFPSPPPGTAPRSTPVAHCPSWTCYHLSFASFRAFHLTCLEGRTVLVAKGDGGLGTGARLWAGIHSADQRKLTFGVSIPWAKGWNPTLSPGAAQISQKEAELALFRRIFQFPPIMSPQWRLVNSILSLLSDLFLMKLNNSFICHIITFPQRSSMPFCLWMWQAILTNVVGLSMG